MTLQRSALLASLALVLLVGCGAAPMVQERPGNPHDNLCGPGMCVEASEWQREGPNPCPCSSQDTGRSY